MRQKYANNLLFNNSINNFKKMKKQLYEQPLAEIFELNLQGSCLQTNLSDGANGYHQGGGGSYGDDDTNDNGDY